MPLKIFTVVILSAASSGGYALSNSLTDPDLAVRREKPSSPALKGFFGVRFARNLRVPGGMKDLVNPEHANSLQKGTIVGDVSFNYSFKPLSLDLSDSHPPRTLRSFFRRSSLFASLDYRRETVPMRDDVKPVCWGSYFCVGDVSLGVSGPAVWKRGTFSLTPTVYLNFPTSKDSYMSRILGGGGVLLASRWRMISNSRFHLSAISSHVLDLNAYYDKKANFLGTAYNRFLVVSNKPGLELRFFTAPAFSRILPVLYVYGNHLYSLNAKLHPRHIVTLSAAAVWKVKKGFQISTGLMWRDKVFAPKGSSARKLANRLVADRTNFTLGFSAAF